MPKKKVSARLQRVVKTLHERASPLFGEINQHVHAENHVHPAYIDSRGQIHLSKRHELSQTWFHLMRAVRLCEVRRQLLLADAAQAAPGVQTALRMFQSVTPHISSENLHIPRIRKSKRIRN